MTRAAAGPLRDNVSTDEITPVTVMLTYDERLGQYPYVGFKAGERMPIGDYRGEERRLPGDGRRQALRQGIVARIEPAWRNCRREYG